LLDQVEIRAVGWQVEEARAHRLGHRTDGRPLVARPS
jgi:hypothetical protein